MMAITSLIYAADPPVIEGTNVILDKTDAVKDLRYGAVLYEFFQENYFEALKLLNIAKAQGGIKNHGDFPELMEGGISLSYGMDNKARDIFARLLDANTEKPVSNQLRFYLAKVLYERGLKSDAQKILATIDQNQLPAHIRDEYLFHKFNLSFDVAQARILQLESIVAHQAKEKSQPAKAAPPAQVSPAESTIHAEPQAEPTAKKVVVTARSSGSKEEQELEALRTTLLSNAEGMITTMNGDSIWRLYATYNLAIAYNQAGQSLKGVSILSKVGESIQAKATLTKEKQDDELRALADRTHLAAGFMHLYDERYFLALNEFKVIRLDSIYSNQALLGYGWAGAKGGNYQLGVTAWTELAKRRASDPAVQEAFVALPYAYEQLGIKGSALTGFEQATANYQQQIKAIDGVIAEVNSGKFIDAFFEGYQLGRVGWFAETPKMPVTLPAIYLTTVVSNGQFQEVLKDIQDLMSLRLNVQNWQNTIGIYRDILESRKIAHENFMHEGGRASLYAEKRALGAELQKKYDKLSAEVAQIKKDRDAIALANQEETAKLLKVYEMREVLETFVEQPHFTKIGDPEKYKQRVERMAEILYWDVHEVFEARLWAVEKQMAIIGSALRETNFSGQGVQKALDISPELQRYGQRIADIENRLRTTLTQLDQTIESHKANMRGLAVARLREQQNSLQQYMWQARLSTVRLYDESIAATEKRAEAKQ